MLDDFYPSDEYETDGWDRGLEFSQAIDVVRDTSLATAQKRAILASWASDSRAVVDARALRQLDDGTILNIDTILDALKHLDGEPVDIRRPLPSGGSTPRHRRGVARALRHLGKSWRNSDDDDYPPPCPVSARVPRLTPSLSGAAAVAAD